MPYFTPPEPGQPDAWTASGGGQQLLEVGIVPAPDEVRVALGLEGGAEVVRRVRLILRDGEPIEVAVSYWPAAWAAPTGLAEAKPVKGGTIRLLADLGWLADDTQDDVSAKIADGVSVPQAPAGAALLVIRRTMFTADRVPFEYAVMHAWDGHGQRYITKAA